MWSFLSEDDVASVEDLPKGAHGFVYLITYSDETYYFGKKDIYKSQKLPALKNGKQREGATRTYKNVKGKRVYYDVVTKETNWLTYEGSCENTKDLEIVSKVICSVAYSKRELTYLEAKTLFWEEALENDDCHNSNILGTFFKGNLK